MFNPSPLRRRLHVPARIHAGYAADTSSTRSSISACRRCARASCAPEQLDAMEPYFPLHVMRLRRLLPRAAQANTSARAHLQRIRLFLVLFDQLGRARQGAIAR